MFLNYFEKNKSKQKVLINTTVFILFNGTIKIALLYLTLQFLFKCLHLAI